MIRYRAHVYRLYPTREQSARMIGWVGTVRCVYNLALEQRRTFARRDRKVTLLSQCGEVKDLRAAFDWIADAPSVAIHQALRDLDGAYRKWYSGQSGPPQFRKRGFNDSMRFPVSEGVKIRRLSRHIGEIKLPKTGWVRLRWDKAFAGELRNATVSLRAGVWTAAVQHRMEVPEPIPSILPAIGIDRGVMIFAAVSDGTMFTPGNYGKRALRSLARANGNLARRQKGSNNRKKQVRRISRIHARIKAARRDFLHKVSTAIAKNHGIVALEKLEVRSLTRSASGTVEQPGKNVRQKTGLNRSILDQGWGAFRTMLAYKLAERGGELIEVNPAYTSQMCAECGVIDAESRRAQRFNCTSCGHAAHADINAARNILERARGTRSQPVEAYA